MNCINFEAYLEHLEEEAVGKYPDQPGMQRAHLCGAFRATAAHWANMFNKLCTKVNHEV